MILCVRVRKFDRHLGLIQHFLELYQHVSRSLDFVSIEIKNKVFKGHWQKLGQKIQREFCGWYFFYRANIVKRFPLSHIIFGITLLVKQAKSLHRNSSLIFDRPNFLVRQWPKIESLLANIFYLNSFETNLAKVH